MFFIHLCPDLCAETIMIICTFANNFKHVFVYSFCSSSYQIIFKIKCCIISVQTAVSVKLCVRKARELVIQPNFIFLLAGLTLWIKSKLQRLKNKFNPIVILTWSTDCIIQFILNTSTFEFCSVFLCMPLLQPSLSKFSYVMTSPCQ